MQTFKFNIIKEFYNVINKNNWYNIQQKFYD